MGHADCPVANRLWLPLPPDTARNASGAALGSVSAPIGPGGIREGLAPAGLLQSQRGR